MRLYARREMQPDIFMFDRSEILRFEGFGNGNLGLLVKGKWWIRSVVEKGVWRRFFICFFICFYPFDLLLVSRTQKNCSSKICNGFVFKEKDNDNLCHCFSHLFPCNYFAGRFSDVALKAFLYLGARAKGIISNTAIPSYKDSLNFFKFSYMNGLSAATDLKHLEVIARSYLYVAGALLGLIKPANE